MADLYRVHDAAGRLLYVGIADDVERRWLGSHGHLRAPWLRYAAGVELTRYADRAGAAEAELTAIRGEAPIFNRAGRSRRETRAALVAYLGDEEGDRLLSQLYGGPPRDMRHINAQLLFRVLAARQRRVVALLRAAPVEWKG